MTSPATAAAAPRPRPIPIFNTFVIAASGPRASRPEQLPGLAAVLAGQDGAPVRHGVQALGGRRVDREVQQDRVPEAVADRLPSHARLRGPEQPGADLEGV